MNLFHLLEILPFQLDYNIYWIEVLRFFKASLINSRKYTDKEPLEEFFLNEFFYFFI